MAGGECMTHLAAAEFIHCYRRSPPRRPTASSSSSEWMKSSDVCSSGSTPQGCGDIVNCKIYQVEEEGGGKTVSVGSSDDSNRPFKTSSSPGRSLLTSLAETPR
ncbi:hypothetical protein JOB18_024167 [Solea senegalensis]|uniref:Uncharacterized protein n=1 Tax=Solea senegalensis TaxID=28829 RepID=A0AAV6RWM5_SOLSE|nr:hypothetical protein JOB18_024167 [Solea senegalensis]